MSNNVIDRIDFIRDLLKDAGDMIVVTGIANLIYILLRVRAERWLK